METIDSRPWILKDIVAEECRLNGRELTQQDRGLIDWLDAHPVEWLDALVYLKKELEAQLSQREAEAAHEKQLCLHMGYAGKDRWFTYESEYLRWRAGVIRMKTTVEGRLSYVKRLAHERQQVKTGTDKSIQDLWDRFHALEDAVFGGTVSRG